jgi:hypothetical protein
MLKSKGKTHMIKKPSHVKQLSVNPVCKIGLNYCLLKNMCCSQGGRAQLDFSLAWLEAA